MSIIKQIIKVELAAAVGLVAYWLHKDAVKEREYKAFANLSKEDLLKIALTDPKYRDNYAMFRTVMSDEAAADFVIRDLLIQNGISSYRD